MKILFYGLFLLFNFQVSVNANSTLAESCLVGEVDYVKYLTFIDSKKPDPSMDKLRLQNEEELQDVYSKLFTSLETANEKNLLKKSQDAWKLFYLKEALVAWESTTKENKSVMDQLELAKSMLVSIRVCQLKALFSNYTTENKILKTPQDRNYVLGSPLATLKIVSNYLKKRHQWNMQYKPRALYDLDYNSGSDKINWIHGKQVTRYAMLYFSENAWLSFLEAEENLVNAVQFKNMEFEPYFYLKFIIENRVSIVDLLQKNFDALRGVN